MELIELLPKVAEYGATGVLALAFYLVARMYHPQFSALTGALKELPAALAALAATISDHSERLEGGLDDVQQELAVIKDRLPRPDSAAVLRELLAQRAAGAGD